MDYKKLSIVFIIIILPISIVLSEYIQNQIDALMLQTEYKNMLIDSTYNAMVGYQMNTLSTTIQTGEDNKRYVLAAVNTFFNSLASNMGISGTSKIDLQTYIPAILFTSYDGYYIYSPTRMPEVEVDDNGIGKVEDGEIQYLTNDDGTTKIAYDYMVRPYVYYSATYSKTGEYDVVINYSLDNYITVYGRIKNNSGNWENFTKSGYLIDYQKVNFNNLYIKVVRDGATDDSANVTPTENPTGDYEVTSNVKYKYYQKDNPDLESYINDYNHIDIDIDGEWWNVNNANSLRYQTGDQIIEDSLKINPNIDVKYDGYDIANIENTDGTTDTSAKEYYIKAYYFSKWIDENLGGKITTNSIQAEIDTNAVDNENNGINDQIRLNFETTEDIKFLKIYNDTNDLVNSPESEGSYFENHKRLVIQNSVLYSLNSAISTYSQNYRTLTDNQLPVLEESDWEKILNNISMTVFMQGVPCGTKYYNDYATITSTNNNQYIDKNNLYFTTELGAASTTNYNDYHKIDCPHLGDGSNPDTLYAADISAEFKYDAREVEVRADNNNYSYDSKTQMYSDDGINFDLTLSDINIYYYDSTANVYYDENWNKLSFPYNGKTFEDFNNSLRTDSNNENSEYNAIIVRETGENMTAYMYDHKNTGCYDCIVSNNYIPVVEFDESGEMVLSSQVYDYEKAELTEYGEKIFGNLSNADTELDNRKKSWYTYIAKYRNNIYKTNDYINR